MRNKTLKDGVHKMTTQGKELLTSKEVAAMFSVRTETVNRWRKSGRLPGFKLSISQVRFTREAVQDFIRAEQAKAAI